LVITFAGVGYGVVISSVGGLGCEADPTDAPVETFHAEPGAPSDAARRHLAAETSRLSGP
jgi:hypothetical protein